MADERDQTFGPRWLTTAEGQRRAQFRLWAPAAETVALVFQSREATMQRTRDGWWQSDPLDTVPGTGYQFRINGEICVPDPASRGQDGDVHGPSLLKAPTHPGAAGVGPEWSGRPWHETVLYELHIGTASTDNGGTFRSLMGQLPRLAEIGFTAIEIMPVADFPGKRNWGYDGVLPYAPDETYGRISDLQALLAAAHRCGISVLLDVVYNHFGPEGNYLHLYAPGFFNPAVDTPWGAAIDFTVPEVRRFFIENALYWIHEVGFDGLRLDAVHAIHDPSPTSVLTEIAREVHRHNISNRHIHLVLENDRNEARFLGPDTDRYTAQWNDDIHHAFHVLLTGETHGYYEGFSRGPEQDLIKALTTGFVYQGDRGPVDEPRGEPSAHHSPTRFIAFLQNHDQIGNRAFGDRLTTLTTDTALRAATAVHLLCPQIPLVFMGEPWNTTAPFQFFCDFGAELSRAVQEGRRREFGLTDLPDPTSVEAYTKSHPGEPPAAGSNADLDWYTQLLTLRHRYLVPILPELSAGTVVGGATHAVSIRWSPGWLMDLNLSSESRPLASPGPLDSPGDSIEVVFTTPGAESGTPGDLLPPWSVRVCRERTLRTATAGGTS